MHDESKIERFLFMSEPLAAIHVEVQPQDYVTARHLVEEWDRTEDSRTQAVHCPQCGSTRVEFPQMTRKFVTTALWMVLAVVRLVPREYYCQDCHYTWPKTEPREPERDALEFPYDSKVMHPERNHPKKET